MPTQLFEPGNVPWNKKREDDDEDDLPRSLNLPTARVFLPLLAPARYKGAWGGRGAAKSHFFAELLLDRCVADSPIRAVCIREVQQSLAQSVKLLLDDKVKVHGLEDQFRVMNTHIETPGGGQIIFRGMKDQTAESIKSLEGFDIAWVEEAQSLSDRSLSLLRPTIRKPGSELWFSWNPRYATDPIDRLLRNEKEQLPDSIVVRANYRDNPWFSDELRREMEWDRRIDPEKYAHIWLGEYERNSEARVFKNWRVQDFVTPEGVFKRYGGDWGFSVDPTVGVRLFEAHPTKQWIDLLGDPTFTTASRKRIYIDREIYRIGVEIDHLPAFFDTLDDKEARNWPIRVDSARPECISYMARHGYRKMVPARKGPNSVKEGVIFLQGYDIIIHPRCKHTIDEFSLYSYKVDAMTGLVTPYLSDKKNHVIDSVRYATEELRIPTIGTHSTSWG